MGKLGCAMTATGTNDATGNGQRSVYGSNAYGTPTGWHREVGEADEERGGSTSIPSNVMTWSGERASNCADDARGH